MYIDLYIKFDEVLKADLASIVEEHMGHHKFYLYSIVTHSTAIEDSTVTEFENQILIDEGIDTMSRS